MPSQSPRHVAGLALVALLFGAVSPALGADDWPQWRGPQRDGAAPASLPTPLPDTLRKVWEVEVGIGHSSPVVAGDRVYLHSRQGEEEVVRALDLATGREIWRHADPTPYTMNPAATKHGKGPKSTPVVTGSAVLGAEKMRAEGVVHTTPEASAVCTLGIAGRLSCFDRDTGRVLWQNDWSGRFDETAPDFGTAMSPAVFDGKLIAHVGGIEAGALAAFEVETGRELWRRDGEGPGYASPILATFDGVPQIVTQTREHVLAVSLDAGKELWQVPLKTPYLQNAVTPFIHGDTVIVSGLANPVIALRPRRAADGGWTSDEAWRSAEVSMYMSSPVLVSGLLVGFTEKRSGQLFALDPASGKVVWLGDPRQGDNAALIAAGDQLLVQNVSGELAIGPVAADGWKAARTYTVADSATWAHPALLGDRILVKDVDSLTLWSFQ